MASKLYGELVAKIEGVSSLLRDAATSTIIEAEATVGSLETLFQGSADLGEEGLVGSLEVADA